MLNIQNEIQAKDIKALLQLENLDIPYIKYWFASLKINTFYLVK